MQTGEASGTSGQSPAPTVLLQAPAVTHISGQHLPGLMEAHTFTWWYILMDTFRGFVPEAAGVNIVRLSGDCCCVLGVGGSPQGEHFLWGWSPVPCVKHKTPYPEAYRPKQKEELGHKDRGCWAGWGEEGLIPRGQWLSGNTGHQQCGTVRPRIQFDCRWAELSHNFPAITPNSKVCIGQPGLGW